MESEAPREPVSDEYNTISVSLGSMYGKRRYSVTLNEGADSDELDRLTREVVRAAHFLVDNMPPQIDDLQAGTTALRRAKTRS